MGNPSQSIFFIPERPVLDSLAQGALPLELQTTGKGSKRHLPHTTSIGLTVDGSPMAQEGFQEVRAGLPSDAGAHLGAGTPSLGGIPPPLCPKLRQGSLQVALGLTGAIPLLNHPSLHRELPVQGWHGLNDVLSLILQHHWCFPNHQGYPVDLHKHLPKVTQL